MLNIILFSISLFLSSSVFAQENQALYQIDLIVFTHQKENADLENNDLVDLPIDTQHAIELGLTDTALTPYHLLPSHGSKLRKAYRSLANQPDYKILLHYSWLQPNDNQKAIAFSHVNDSWQVQGTIRIRHGLYYTLDTNLQFLKNNQIQPMFSWSQKQRLKEDKLYYLDHPQAGMLINIHPLA